MMHWKKLTRPLVVAVSLALLSATAVSATVWTDQEDYSPGSVVTISGDNANDAGYLPGETVHVEVSGPNDWTATCDGVADDNGAWSCQVTLFDGPEAVGEYSYTATGIESGTSENGTFTDGSTFLRAMVGATPIAVTFPTGATASTPGSLQQFRFNSTCSGSPQGWQPAAVETNTDGTFDNLTSLGTFAGGSSKMTAPATVVISGTTYAFSSWAVVASGPNAVNGSVSTTGTTGCVSGWNASIPTFVQANYVLAAAPTTTSLNASPASPQEVGTNVTFTAHVTMTSDSTDVTTGSVSFYDGGTCAAPGTQIGSAQNLDSDGEASVQTSSLSIAVHTILACYGGATGFQASGASISYTITKIATTTTLTITPSTQQYSDKVNLSASITPSAATGSVQFQKSVGGGAFSDVGSPVNVSSGTAAVNDQQILQAAGTNVQFKAVFAGTGNYGNSSDTKSLTVTKEDASITYGSGNPAAAQVSSPGSGSWTGPLVLSISVQEKTPDLAGAGTAAPGYIIQAGLSVVLSNIAGGGNITLNCVAGTVTGTGYSATKPFTCTSPGAIPLGVYEVQVNVTGDYYTATYLDAFTVYDPSLGFATGGGWFLIGSDKVNFGFVTKYNKNGTNPQGSFIAVRHFADGTIARLKSNSLTGLAIAISNDCGNAQISGKSTYTRWDQTANGGLGAYVTTGNNLFSASAWDCNNPGTGVDKIWINGVGDLKMSGTGSLANATVIGGGNVAVPHVTKK